LGLGHKEIDLGCVRRLIGALDIDLPFPKLVEPFLCFLFGNNPILEVIPEALVREVEMLELERHGQEFLLRLQESDVWPSDMKDLSYCKDNCPYDMVFLPDCPRSNATGRGEGKEERICAPTGSGQGGTAVTVEGFESDIC